MNGKSAEAFRTISEVADLIGTPAHVLRFWETKFGQIRPVKRAGGRRYYRPADVALIDGIRRLLHDEGMTIRGVQKILREKGQRHVAALSRYADSPEVAEEEAATPPSAPPARPEGAAVAVQARHSPAPEPEPAPAPVSAPVSAAADPWNDAVTEPDAAEAVGSSPLPAPPPAAEPEDTVPETPAGAEVAEAATGALPAAEPEVAAPATPEAPVAAETADVPAPAPALPDELAAAGEMRRSVRPRPPQPQMPELPFADLPRQEPPRPAPRPASPPRPLPALPVAALLRRLRPEAVSRTDLAALEPRLAALAERLSAPAPGPHG